MSVQIRMADNWKELHRRSSVRLSALVAAMASIGPEIVKTWAVIPDDLKAILPTSLKQTLGYAILALSFIALRYTVIERKPKEDEK